LKVFSDSARVVKKLNSMSFSQHFCSCFTFWSRRKSISKHHMLLPSFQGQFHFFLCHICHKLNSPLLEPKSASNCYGRQTVKKQTTSLKISEANLMPAKASSGAQMPIFHCWCWHKIAIPLWCFITNMRFWFASLSSRVRACMCRPAMNTNLRAMQILQVMKYNFFQRNFSMFVCIFVLNGFGYTCVRLCWETNASEVIRRFSFDAVVDLVC
jgi:hypothetical protein